MTTDKAKPEHYCFVCEDVINTGNCVIGMCPGKRLSDMDMAKLLCDCDGSTKCPLGRVGSQDRCRVSDLRATIQDRDEKLKEALANQRTPQIEKPVSPAKQFGRDMADAGNRSCKVCGRSWTWVGRDGECGGYGPDERGRCPIRSGSTP